MKNVTDSFVSLGHWPSAGSFGFNTDIFATNLINLSVVLGVLIFFGKGVPIRLGWENRSCGCPNGRLRCRMEFMLEKKAILMPTTYSSWGRNVPTKIKQPSEPRLLSAMQFKKGANEW